MDLMVTQDEQMDKHASFRNIFLLSSLKKFLNADPGAQYSGFAFGDAHKSPYKTKHTMNLSKK